MLPNTNRFEHELRFICVTAEDSFSAFGAAHAALSEVFPGSVIGGIWSGIGNPVYREFVERFGFSREKFHNYDYQLIWKALGGTFTNPHDRDTDGGCHYDDDAIYIEDEWRFGGLKLNFGNAKIFIVDQGMEVNHLDTVSYTNVAGKWLVVSDYQCC